MPQQCLCRGSIACVVIRVDAGGGRAGPIDVVVMEVLRLLSPNLKAAGGQPNLGRRQPLSADRGARLACAPMTSRRNRRRRLTIESSQHCRCKLSKRHTINHHPVNPELTFHHFCHTYEQAHSKIPSHPSNSYFVNVLYIPRCSSPQSDAPTRRFCRLCITVERDALHE